MHARAGLLLLALCAAAPAAATQWQIDGQASSAGFEVPVLRFFTAHGSFQGLSGTLSWDSATRQLRVAARIPTGTLAMASERQARWAKSKDFFDVEHHPEIVFEAGPVTLDALREGMVIEGKLILRGQPGPVHLTLGPTDCDLGGTKPCRLAAGTRVARTAFGLPRYRALVGDDVTLSLDVVAHPLP